MGLYRFFYHTVKSLLLSVFKIIAFSLKNILAIFSANIAPFEQTLNTLT